MEKHHLVPISLWGLDISQNIVELSYDEHRLVHLTCDYSKRVFGEIWRSFRKRWNCVNCFSPAMAGDIARMQIGWLVKVEYLPPRLQEIYHQGLNNLCLVFDESHRQIRCWDCLLDEYERLLISYYSYYD